MGKLLLLIVLIVCVTITAFATDIGKWVYEKGINPINDKVVVTFKLECEKSELEKPIFLILKKEGKKTTIYIDWSVEVTTPFQSMVSVKTRFGDRKATKSLRWDPHNITFDDVISQVIFGKRPKVASQHTFYSGRKIRYIKKLMDVDRFVVEVKAMNRKLTAVFDIRGLKNAVEQFNDILGWIKD